MIPAEDHAAQHAEAVQRLFELRLVLGRPEEAAAGVLAATSALQHAGSYEARPKYACQASKPHLGLQVDRTFHAEAGSPAEAETEKRQGGMLWNTKWKDKGCSGSVQPLRCGASAFSAAHSKHGFLTTRAAAAARQSAL